MSNEVISGEPGSTGSGSPGAEDLRLREARTGTPWRAWGPYLSERQWGTVREDYSDNGDAWSYFTHDQARSRAYRWGEDGLAGISDDKQRLCLALALWNEQDPILKERLFGLTNAEGNHGEDVKEYYFYVDNVPTHSYQRWLYKYPQAELPVRRPGRDQPGAVAARRSEYELLDTGVFDDDRYFDVEVELRQGRPRGHLSAASPCTTAARGGAAPPAADAVVPQHVVLGRPASQADGSPGSTRRTRSSGPKHHRARRLLPARRPGGASCCSARTRRTPRACSAASRPRRFPKDGIGDQSSRWRRHRQPRRRGHQGRRARPAGRCPAGGQASVLVCG